MKIEIRIPLDHHKELEDLQNTLIEIVVLLHQIEDEETIHKCIYWLSRIMMFSEHPEER